MMLRPRLRFLQTIHGEMCSRSVVGCTLRSTCCAMLDILFGKADARACGAVGLSARYPRQHGSRVVLIHACQLLQNSVLRQCDASKTAWFGTAVVSGRDPSSSCYREVLTCLDRSARATTTVAEYELDPIDY